MATTAGYGGLWNKPRCRGCSSRVVRGQQRTKTRVAGDLEPSLISSFRKEGRAGRLTYFSGQIGTVSLQKEGKARRLTYFCGRTGRLITPSNPVCPGYLM